jgi:hypothetical protein
MRPPFARARRSRREHAWATRRTRPEGTLRRRETSTVSSRRGEGPGPDPDELRKSYDRVAGDYAAEYADEMTKKAFDRRILDWLAEKTAGLGPI